MINLIVIMSLVLILQNVGVGPQYFFQLNYNDKSKNESCLDFAERWRRPTVLCWMVTLPLPWNMKCEAEWTSVSRDGAAPSFEPRFHPRFEYTSKWKAVFFFRHWYLLDVEQFYITYVLYYRINKCQII